MLWPPQIYILKILSDVRNLSQLFWHVSDVAKAPLLFQILGWENGNILSVLPGDYRHEYTPEALRAANSEHFLRVSNGQVQIQKSQAAHEFLLSLIR